MHVMLWIALMHTPVAGRMLLALLTPLVLAALFYAMRTRVKLFRQHLAELQSQLLVEAYEAANDVQGETAAGGLEPIAEEASGGVAVQSLHEVPRCVRDYLSHAIRDSRRFKLFTLRQQLQLRFEPGGRWNPAPGTQRASPVVPCFLFTGRAALAPGVWVEGYECLLRGKGCMEWRLWGAFSLGSGEGELLDKAGRVRWLSEAVAYPQALVPSPFLRWQAVEGRADQGRAVLDYRGVAVSGIFTFDSRHNVVGFRSDDYSRALPDKRVVCCTLVGRCRDHMLLGLSSSRSEAEFEGRHAAVGGIVVPRESEAAYVDEVESEIPYVRVLLSRAEAV